MVCCGSRQMCYNPILTLDPLSSDRQRSTWKHWRRSAVVKACTTRHCQSSVTTRKSVWDNPDHHLYLILNNASSVNIMSRKQGNISVGGSNLALILYRIDAATKVHRHWLAALPDLTVYIERINWKIELLTQTALHPTRPPPSSDLQPRPGPQSTPDP